MDTEPTTSGSPVSPPKKRGKLGHLSHAEKQTLISVYKSLANETKGSATSLYVKTSKLTGWCEEMMEINLTKLLSVL